MESVIEKQLNYLEILFKEFDTSHLSYYYSKDGYIILDGNSYGKFGRIYINKCHYKISENERKYWRNIQETKKYECHNCGDTWNNEKKTNKIKKQYKKEVI